MAPKRQLESKAAAEQRSKLAKSVGKLVSVETTAEENQQLDEIVKELKARRYKIAPTHRHVFGGIIENSLVDYSAWFCATNPYMNKVPKCYLKETLLPHLMRSYSQERLKNLESAQRGVLQQIFYRACCVEPTDHISYLNKQEFLTAMGRRATHIGFSETSLFLEDGKVDWGRSGFYTLLPAPTDGDGPHRFTSVSFLGRVEVLLIPLPY